MYVNIVVVDDDNATSMQLNFLILEGVKLFGRNDKCQGSLCSRNRMCRSIHLSFFRPNIHNVKRVTSLTMTYQVCARSCTFSGPTPLNFLAI